MTDYTPTTEEVRAAWIDAHRVDTPLGGRMDMEARPRERIREFDRWMASVLAEQGEPEVAEEWIAYANIIPSGTVLIEPRGLNYSTHHRTVKAGPWEPNAWSVEENTPHTEGNER